MSIPPEPILNFIYWLLNTPGIGGLAVAAIVLACLGGSAAVLRWIVAAGQVDEGPVYPYPPSALHHRD